MEAMAEIVDLPIDSMGIFPISYVNVYQRVIACSGWQWR